MKRFMCFLFVLSLSFSVSGCGPSQDRNFDIEEYRQSVFDLCSSVEEYTIYYSSMAQSQSINWKAMETMGLPVTTEKLLEYAEEWISKEAGLSLSDLDDKYEEHSELYKQLITTETEGKEAEEIALLLRVFFEAYVDMRSAVMSPSGSRVEYVSKINSIASEFISARDSILIFLE